MITEATTHAGSVDWWCEDIKCSGYHLIVYTPRAPSAVDHPAHYTRHPSGIEAIDVTEHFNFCLGNAIKYIWRAGLKGERIEDLKKARWYLTREIDRLEKEIER